MSAHLHIVTPSSKFLERNAFGPDVGRWFLELFSALCPDVGLWLLEVLPVFFPDVALCFLELPPALCPDVVDLWFI